MLQYSSKEKRLDDVAEQLFKRINTLQNQDGVWMGKELEIGVLLDYYGSLLTPTQQHVARLYYDEDLSLAEIAEHLGITRQGVYDNIHRTTKILRDFEEALGLMAKSRREREIAEEICLLCDGLSCAGRSEINDLKERIQKAAKSLIQEEMNGI